MDNKQISIAAKHFLIAALFADAPEGTRPRITEQARKSAWRFVRDFAITYPLLVQSAVSREGYGAHPDCGGSPFAALGHDIYLTCAGHGAGFSDRAELGNIGPMLADAVRRDWRRWHIDVEFSRGWLYVHVLPSPPTA